MVVFRDEASVKEEDIFSVMEVELTKKPGKGLGLSIVGRKYGNGVFISDVVSFLKRSWIIAVGRCNTRYKVDCCRCMGAQQRQMAAS
jgi:hypothetical protein